jgi:hypothetical protein
LPILGSVAEDARPALLGAQERQRLEQAAEEPAIESQTGLWQPESPGGAKQRIFLPLVLSVGGPRLNQIPRELAVRRFPAHQGRHAFKAYGIAGKASRLSWRHKNLWYVLEASTCMGARC